MRHYTIMNHLIDSGLKKDSSILEIGCGIGQVTRLIHDFVQSGNIVATDISNEGIAIAQQHIGKSERLKFVVTDMSEFSLNEKFDFILLPDVLEHIPVEQHDSLFKILSGLMHSDSTMLIHIPHPKNIDYLRIHSPETLQIIDQSLNANELISKAYDSGLFLTHYNAYGLYDAEDDYVLIKFRINYAIERLQPISNNLIRWKKMKARVQVLVKKFL
jgi:trans-aconitate 2-methyltransferase